MKVALEIPDVTFACLRRSPDEFRAELRITSAVKWHELGRISRTKASEIAALHQAEFVAALHAFGAPRSIASGRTGRGVASISVWIRRKGRFSNRVESCTIP